MSTETVLRSMEYEALLSWAEAGARSRAELAAFYALRKRVDSTNAITRHTLVIRWDPLPQQVQPLTEGLPGQTKVLELQRPPTREDVIDALAGESFHPSMVWVTADPNGEVGFYELELYPWG